MALEIKVPVLPESVSQAIVSKWNFKIGDFVNQDDVLVDIETDKVILEVAATASGIIKEIHATHGAKVKAHDVLGLLQPQEKEAAKQDSSKQDSSKQEDLGSQSEISEELALRPSARKALREHPIDANQLIAISQKGPVTQEAIEKVLSVALNEMPTHADKHEIGSFRQEKREPLSPLRQRIAQRLVSAQHTAAMLTTFNEVDMSAIIQLRNEYREAFEKKFGVKLGFMSFFMKAVSLSLEAFPTVNAYIDQDQIVYHNYCDIGVAVSSERGLVVPVIKNVQLLSFAECEKTLADMADKARKGKIAMSDLQGGTFTITNGGVFGSLLSTPIINPPQSAILGMHKIQDRPVAINGQVMIKPMMYLALSYDHRLIDGAQAVGFLVDVKKCLEHPENFFLNML